MKHGKKYNESAKLIDRAKVYESNEALDLVCKTAKAKFDETVELHVRLGVDSRHADQQVRGAVVLPNGIGKTIRTLVFCKPEKEAEAKEAGADYIADSETVAKVQGGWMDFEVVIASPDMMPAIKNLGKVLGPRGLMPNAKTGTVTQEIGKAVQEAKAGKVEYRLEKNNIIHCPIGKASFGAEKLEENFNTIMEAVAKAKPAAAKGQYIKSCTVSSTMGPGVKVNTLRFGN